jgi:hypothetical protein
MKSRPRYIGFIACILVVLCGRIAYANSLSPYVYFWPGVIWTAIEYAFPASILAAFIERPFYTRSGITGSTLWYSLQANFVSTIVGILLIPIGYPALYTLGPLWSVVAFGISCLVEFAYLSWKTGEPPSIRWFVAGNATSALVLVLIPPVAIHLRETYYDATSTLDPYSASMMWSATIGSLVLFLASFLIPSFVTRQKPPPVSLTPSDREDMSFGPVQEVLSGEPKQC